MVKKLLLISLKAFVLIFFLTVAVIKPSPAFAIDAQGGGDQTCSATTPCPNRINCAVGCLDVSLTCVNGLCRVPAYGFCAATYAMSNHGCNNSGFSPYYCTRNPNEGTYTCQPPSAVPPTSALTPTSTTDPCGAATNRSINCPCSQAGPSTQCASGFCGGGGGNLEVPGPLMCQNQPVFITPPPIPTPTPFLFDGFMCPGGPTNCANHIPSNYSSCSGKPNYLGNPNYDNWCNRNYGGANAYCYSCIATTTPTPTIGMSPTPSLPTTCNPDKTGTSLNKIDNLDFAWWVAELNGTRTTKASDCNTDQVIDIFDFNKLRDLRKANGW